MFGDGKVRTLQKGKKTTTTDNNGKPNAAIMKTEIFTYVNGPKVTKSEGGESPDPTDGNAPNEVNKHGWDPTYTAPNGNVYTKINPKFYAANTSGKEGKNIETGFEDKQKYFCSYDLKIEGSVIEVSANSFPGTYYCTGDTFARSETSGEDEFFQLIFPKAKVTSENTITLEAEGDPSTFNMNLRILRPADGIMMKLVKYNLIDEKSSGTGDGDTSVMLPHNHILNTKSENTKNLEPNGK